MNREIARRKIRLPVAYLLLLGCFVGLSGLHRFYCGRWKSGILWLLTAGLCGVGNLIDLVVMRNLVNDANGG
jgi:TM2 domain-containing membrane protein YozV